MHNQDPYDHVTVKPGTHITVEGLGIEIGVGYSGDGHDFEQPYVTIDTAGIQPEHAYGEGMSIIAVHMNDATLLDDEGAGNIAPPIDGPPVFVVRPFDPMEDAAVFAREEDAHAFRQTYEDTECGDVERCNVITMSVARRMIEQRIDEEDPDDENGLSTEANDDACPNCGGVGLDGRDWMDAEGDCVHCGRDPHRGPIPEVEISLADLQDLAGGETLRLLASDHTRATIAGDDLVTSRDIHELREGQRVSYGRYVLRYDPPEPSDDQIYNGPGREGGIAYTDTNPCNFDEDQV